MTYRSSCNQTTLWTTYGGFAHFGKDRRELVSVTVETWKDRRAYTEDIHEKAAEYRLCDGVLAPVIDVRQFPCSCCQYTAPATECVAICTYQAVPYNFENTPSVWTWTVVGGTIVSGQGTDTIEVQTVSGVDVEVDITVVATDPASGDTAGATGKVNHCHDDTTVCPVFIGPPFQDSSYADGYTVGSFTTADRFFGYITTYALVGNWPAGISIDVNTGVISGTMGGVGTYTGLQVSAYGDGRCPIVYSNVFQIEITDATEEGLEITETVGGSCDWDIGTGGCTATGTYLATPSGFATPPDTWFWEVTTANATIISGQGSDTVQVSTTGGTNVTFTLKATASNSSGELAIDTGQFVHDHNDTIEETLLVSEVVSGSCDYQSPSVLCAANGTYTASPGGFNIPPDNWFWEVVTGAAVITSGQGTQTVVVTSDAASDVTFTLKATATNLFTLETANDQQVFTHTHTQLSSQLLALPLLQDRYEDGGGTNHALLSRATTALVSVRNGGTIGGYQVAEINEFRFQDTYRYSPADGSDYGAGVLGVRYEDTDLSSDGLVIHETGDNLIIWSEQFEADTWYQQSGAIVTDNQVVAPNGATSGALLELPSTGSYLMNLCDDPFDPPIDPYTFSVYIKKAATNPTTHVIINITGGGWGGAASSTLKVAPTDQWIRYDVWGNFFSNMNCFIGSVNIDGFDDPDVQGNVLVWGAQVNRNQVVNAYYPTSGFAVSQEYDDVHCLWPAGVVNDFTLSVEWMPTMTKACTILETGNFRLFWTGTDFRVTNGNGTAIFTTTLVPYSLYFIQLELSSTTGIILKVDTVNGTQSADTTDIIPDTDLQIGARANLTEFINGTIKNINMTTDPLPSGNPTFDSTTVTFDSTAYTMDMT